MESWKEGRMGERRVERKKYGRRVEKRDGKRVEDKTQWMVGRRKGGET